VRPPGEIENRFATMSRNSFVVFGEERA